MFCGCPTAFGAEPNTQVCPVCLGLPGSLPVVNAHAVESAIRIGLALNCSIARVVPLRPEELLLPGHAEELPDLPVRRADRLRRLPRRASSTTARRSGSRSSARTWRRTPASPCTSAAPPAVSTAPTTRCSTTTAPASRSSRSSPSRSSGPGERAPEVAKAYVTALRDLLRALGVSDVRMEQGSLRCDANLSLMPKGTTMFGTRTETKNVNSLRSVERAVRYEITAARRRAARRRHDRAGDPALRRGDRAPPRRAGRRRPRGLPLLPRARPGAARAVAASGSRSCAAALPELPVAAPARGSRPSGASPTWRCAIVNAGALDLVAATVDAGAPPPRPALVVGGLPRAAGQRGGRRRSPSCRSPRRRWPGSSALVADGRADQQARPPGRRRRARRRGRARRGRRGRGLTVVSDEGALHRRVDEAIAAQPGRRRQDPRRQGRRRPAPSSARS